MEQNAEYWKKKYEESETNLQKLKLLAHQGCTDYEQLKKKYDQNYKQYEEVKEQLEQAQQDLKSLDYYAKQAVEEYGELENKLQFEKQLCTEVSKYAAEVTQEKKKYQRQSQALLDKLGDSLTVVEMGELTEEPEINGDTGNSLDLELQSRVEELSDQVASLESRLAVAEQERDDSIQHLKLTESRLEIEKQKAKRLEISVKEHQKSLQKVQRVSLLAIEEHEELKTKYEMEKGLKEEVVKEAQRIEQERKTVVRQSAVAIAEVSTADERLREAFEKMEEESKKLGEANAQLKIQEVQLQELQDNKEHIKSIDRLQQQLDEANDAIRKLETQAKDAQKWNEKLHKDYEEIEKKLEEANARLVPPPPPPPPPPPIVLRPILKLMRKDPMKKARLDQLQKDKPPEFAQALEQLMSKIKRGEPLLQGSTRSVHRSRGAIPFDRNSDASNTSIPTLRHVASVDDSSSRNKEPETHSAMQEMHNMLRKMKFKKSFSECDVAGSAGVTNNTSNGVQFEGPLADAFNKVRGSVSAAVEEEKSVQSEKL